MARNSISAAKAELFALISAGGTSAGLTVAYDHEPFAGDAQKPMAATVATVGMNPDYYLLALRIYSSAEASVKLAQDDLDLVIQAVDALMTSGFGPSNWTVEYRPDFACFVAENVFEVGREDDSAYR